MIFVTSRDTGQVYSISGATLAISGTIPVGSSPFGLAANPVNRLLYVANFGSGSVSIINMDTRSVVLTQSTGGRPTFIAVDLTTGDAFVALNAANQVARFNNATYLGNFMVAGAEVFGIALDSGASPKRLYVGTRQSPNGQVLVYNVSSSPPTYLTTLTPGGAVYGMTVNRITGNLYVMHSDTSDANNARFMSVYSRTGARVAGPWDIGVNTFDGGGLDILTNNNNRVYVAGTECIPGVGACAGYGAGGRVQIIQGLPPFVARSLLQPPIQPGPFGVAVDESRKRIYVTSKGNGGWLNVIEDFEFGSP